MPDAPSTSSAATSARLTLLLCLGALYFIWGTTYLAMRVVVLEVSPFLMGSARFLLAGTILAVALRLRGAPLPSLKEWLYALPVGTCLFVLGNGLVGLAEQKVSSAAAAVVCATTPLCAAALAPFLGDKFKRTEVLGTVLGVLGVVVLFSGAEFKAELGSALILAVAPIGWALGSLLTRRLPLAKGLMSAATQMVTGGLVMGLVAAARGELALPNPSAKAIGSWVYLVIFGSLVSFSAYNWLLRNARPALAMSYSYVNPAVAVAMGAFIGNEHLGPEMVPALLLVTLATVATVKARTVAAPEPAELRPQTSDVRAS
jgi:drug/metabolite transporter (DMT)-like permease